MEEQKKPLKILSSNTTTENGGVPERKSVRHRLPRTRKSITHTFNIAGHKGYLTVGMYENSQPGEIFITMAKEGSTIGGLMDSFGIAISLALQSEVALETIIEKFSYTHFEPSGMTNNPDIPFAKSIVDYIARWMGITFQVGYRENHCPKKDST